MIRFFLIFLFAIVSATSYAQFKASPLGFVSEDDKDFVVFEIPGKSASELYISVKAWVNKNFRNPDAVFNEVENKQINIHVYYPKAYVYTRDNLLGINYWADADINYIIQFKDAKVKVESPIVNSMYLDGNMNSRIGFCGTLPGGSGIVKRNLFKKNGTENKPKAIHNINEFINREINSIISSLSKEEEW